MQILVFVIVALVGLVVGTLVYCAVLLRELVEHAADIFEAVSGVLTRADAHDVRETERHAIRQFTTNTDGRELLRQRLAARLAPKG